MEFKPDIDVILNENYRSTQSILDVANDVISHNNMRIPKDLFSQTNVEIKPEFFHLQDDNKEGNTIACLIREVHKSLPYKQMAVLYRNASISNHIERALIAEKIPYTIWGGVRFYERREIKDILAYLRLIASKDDLAFNRIINVPSRHIGPVSLNKVRQVAEANTVCLFDALPHVELKRNNLIQFRNDINELTELSRTESIASLINHVIEKFNLTDWYENDEERLENIEELKRSSILYVDEMKKQDKKYDLKSFLQDIALYTNVDQDISNDKVRLMTIHQSKGLEFSCVFLCGLTDGILPSRRTIEESGKIGLEEERRLMYVALTRAKEKLYLTDAKGYSYFGEKTPSRFINEIDKKHLIFHVESIESKTEIHKDVAPIGVYNADSSSKSTKTKETDIFCNSMFGPYKHGDVVRHYKYGICIFDKYIDDGKCLVRQSNKTLDVNVAHLFKINKDNYIFTKGQWVESTELGLCKYIKDLSDFTCVVEYNGQETTVDKYKLQKLNENRTSKHHSRFVVGDIVKYDAIFGEVYECTIGVIRLHINSKKENDVTLPMISQDIRLVIHPSKNKTYKANCDNELHVFIYKKTEKDENGLMLVGEDENGNESKMTPEVFFSSKYMVLKHKLSTLKEIYAKISERNELIQSNSSKFTKTYDPFSKVDTFANGDIIRIGTKHYVYISREKGKVVCKKISTTKQQLMVSDDNIEFVVRPNNNMFYKDKTKYYYFDRFRVVGAHLLMVGVYIERGKCKLYYTDINQLSRKNMKVCSEKEFWENCKDKVGYVSYRFKIKLL